MGVIKPWAMDAKDGQPEYDGATLRRIMSGLLSAGDRPTHARPGVLSGGDVTVIDDVAYVGECLVVVTTPDGSFLTGLDADQAIPLAPRDATNPRIDRVVVQIRHDAATRGAEVTVLTGTSAPNPQAPATPTGAESLGTIDIPSAGGPGAVFTPGQRYTAARGGIIAVPNQTALGRLTEGTLDHPAYATVGGRLHVSTGNGWERGDAHWRELHDEDVFSSISPEVSVFNSAHALIQQAPGSPRRLVTLQFNLAIDRLEGTQNTLVGVLAPDIRPASPTPVPAYIAPGTAMFGLSINGNLAIRYSPTSGGGALYGTQTYVTPV